MNLLEQIKSNPNHPFNFLRINDDNTGIKVPYKSNGYRTIYGETESLEALLQEVIINEIIGESKVFYDQEYKLDNGKRLDLAAIPFGKFQPVHIVEFKNINSEKIDKTSFNKELEQAFSQAKTYISTNEDIFVSVVVGDISKLVERPELLEYYLTQNKENGVKPYDVFKNCGFFIETRKYNALNQDFDNQFFSYELPRMLLIELHNKEDAFGERAKIAKLKHAVLFPTSSSEFGIKNVRDIKPLETSAPKRLLTNDVLETLINGYFKKDLFLFFKKSKEKDFVYIDKYTHIHKNQSNINGTNFAITTLSGAIIDGQNSLDSVNIVIRIIEKTLANLNGADHELSKYENDLLRKIQKAGITTVQNFNDFLTHIKESFVSIKTTSTENEEQARDIAIAKNNTMEVTKNELAVSSKIDLVQSISSALFQSSGYILNYPKKRNKGISIDYLNQYGLDISSAAQLYKVSCDASKENVSTKNLLEYQQRLSKDNAVKDINFFCGEFTISNEDEKSKQKLSKYQDDLSKKESEIKLKRKELKDDIERLSRWNAIPNFPASEIDILEERIDILDSEIKNLKNDVESINNKIKSTVITDYKICNLKRLNNFFKTVINLRKAIANNEFVNNIPAGALFRGKNVFSVIFVVAFHKLNVDLDNKEISYKTFERLLGQFEEAILFYREEYPSVNITSIKNFQNAETVNKNGEVVTVEKARQDFFKFFK